MTGAETLEFLACLRGGTDVAYRAALEELFRLDPDKKIRAGRRATVRRCQTVFLSSHILREVEAVCDRVGILRSGRLVDEGTLTELRHLSAQTVDVTFDGPVPDLSPLPGVRAIPVGSSALRFEVTGRIAPLLAALAD
jgi:ABC-2 type transport system ATP-binding protein